mmetsp:Transcript_10613/g.25957  ORF Transcript_10613/g.25957 Transcript_10613/m.25957 type:complete len:81 (-) Transcript_10613:205-447(-)
MIFKSGSATTPATMRAVWITLVKGDIIVFPSIRVGKVNAQNMDTPTSNMVASAGSVSQAAQTAPICEVMNATAKVTLTVR